MSTQPPIFRPPSPTENYNVRVYYQNILGGTNNTEPIELDDVFALCEEFIYTIQRQRGAMGWAGPDFWLGKLGPYVSGHRRNTPQNPTGALQSELVGDARMYGGPSDPASPYFSVRNVVPYQNTPIDRKRGFLYKSGENVISASNIIGAIRLIFALQTLISYAVHKLTVYGEGGNTGYFNPATYSSTRQFTFAYNQPHRTRWRDGEITLNANTPYGNPLEDPEARPAPPNNALAWSVDLVYGTSLVNLRQSVNEGNQPIPVSQVDAQSPPSTPRVTAGSMAMKFYGPGFPSNIPFNNPPVYHTSFPVPSYPPAIIDPTPSRRDGRVIQPRWGTMDAEADLTGRIGNLSQGDVILRSSIMEVIDRLATQWHSADLYSTTMFERIVCHASCHSNCHGSRGRR